MAARRLLIIMVVLLTISTLAAALVPPPEEQQETSTSTSTTTTGPDPEKKPKGGDLVRAEVPVPRRNQAPEEIKVEPGDQLALTVTSGEPGEVSIPDFGLIEFAGPGNNASFDLLIDERGDFPVRFRGSGVVATIVAKPEKPQGGDKKA